MSIIETPRNRLLRILAITTLLGGVSIATINSIVQKINQQEALIWPKTFAIFCGYSFNFSDQNKVTYAQLAEYDVVNMDFMTICDDYGYSSTMLNVVDNLRIINSDIKVLAYIPITNCYTYQKDIYDNEIWQPFNKSIHSDFWKAIMVNGLYAKTNKDVEGRSWGDPAYTVSDTFTNWNRTYNINLTSVVAQDSIINIIERYYNKSTNGKGKRALQFLFDYLQVPFDKSFLRNAWLTNTYGDADFDQDGIACSSDSDEQIAIINGMKRIIQTLSNDLSDVAMIANGNVAMMSDVKPYLDGYESGNYPSLYYGRSTYSFDNIFDPTSAYFISNMINGYRTSRGGPYLYIFNSQDGYELETINFAPYTILSSMMFDQVIAGCFTNTWIDDYVGSVSPCFDNGYEHISYLYNLGTPKGQLYEIGRNGIYPIIRRDFTNGTIVVKVISNTELQAYIVDGSGNRKSLNVYENPATQDLSIPTETSIPTFTETQTDNGLQHDFTVNYEFHPSETSTIFLQEYVDGQLVEGTSYNENNFGLINEWQEVSNLEHYFGNKGHYYYIGKKITLRYRFMDENFNISPWYESEHVVTTVNPPDSDYTCSIDNQSLNFDSVNIGSYSDKTFTITNAGIGILSGTPSINCSYYSITSGGSAYTLTSGQNRVVTVRYAPLAAGTHTCTVNSGSTYCSNISCTGVGTLTYSGTVSSTTLNFGIVNIGSYVDKTFTITNTGIGILTGTISLTSDVYSILENPNYNIDVGQNKIYTIRYVPTIAIIDECIVETGNNNLSDVSCTGTGKIVAICNVNLSELNFGTIEVNSYLDKTFRISSTGTAVLNGMVELNDIGEDGYSYFSIISGGGNYSLLPGTYRDVVVRYAPTVAGTHSCAVGSGAKCYTDPYCLGSAVDVIECNVDPVVLDFGTVNVNSYVDKIFTITNNGTTVLDGIPEISSNNNYYSIISGGYAYSLSPNQSRNITIRYAPLVAGTHTCAINNGNLNCNNISCTGVGQDIISCNVSPTTLDFGAVNINTYSDKIFTIINTGTSTISGTSIVLSGDEFSIISGGELYSLLPNESKVVTIRYIPTSVANHEGTIYSGNSNCTNVSCIGSGQNFYDCDVVPATLDFGTVSVGSYVDKTFTITNSGTSTLTGTITESCSYYSISSGGGEYSLNAGQNKTITVRYAPTVSGTHTCSISIGNENCTDVDCTGIAQDVISCLINNIALDFGTVNIGSYVDRIFTITNNGTSVLMGNVVGSGDNSYSISSGGGEYSLSAGQNKTITIRFNPATSGTKTYTISVGNVVCSDVSCTGVGNVITGCSITETSYNFGNVNIGDRSYHVFRIASIGTANLVGLISENSDDYSIIEGSGSFNIPPGNCLDVTIRFSPLSVGSSNCTISLGMSCIPYYYCYGAGQSVVSCAVSSTTLNFGTVNIGSYVDRTFTITNNGTNTLSGTPSINCSYYSITSGGSAYTLTSGQSQTVTVRYAPTVAGTHTCTVNSGDSNCSDVLCTGVGQDIINCSIDYTSLNFGIVVVDTYADQTFTITNNGTSNLSVNITESCSYYSILSGGGEHSIVAGQSQAVTIRYQPTVTGTHTCSISVGSANCSNISCTGICISSGSNYLLNGSSYIITGTGFGTMTPSTDILCWDDFNSGTVGQEVITSPIIGTWHRTTRYGPYSVYSNNSPYLGGSVFLRGWNTNDAANSDQMVDVVLPSDLAELYVSYKFRYHIPCHTLSPVYKIFELYGVVDGNYSYGDYAPSIMSGYGATYWDPDNTTGSGSCSEKPNYCLSACQPMGGDNVWQSFELIAKQSPIGSAGGSVKVIYNYGSDPIASWQNITTRTLANSYWYEVRPFYGIKNTGCTTTYTNSQDIDDLYVARTWTRVELGSSSVYDNCIKEIQIPTSWSSTSITFTCRTGLFTTGDTVYIYVTDNNNTTQMIDTRVIQ